MNKILFFNPRSARSKPRIPNSILSIAASVEGIYDYVIVDGNMESDPWVKINSYFESGEFKYFALTAMPGPQLQQAIPYSKQTKKLYPEIIIIWGGYFASNQHASVLNSGFVDFVVYGPGDKAFPALVHSLNNSLSYNHVPNLIFLENGNIIKTQKDGIYDQDKLPDLPYKKLDHFYSLKNYLGRSYLGTKTIAYHSSIGCPFTCSFCAVVPIYNARYPDWQRVDENHAAETRRQLKLPDHYFLAVGVNLPHKNYRWLIDAYSAWPLAREYPLVIAGARPTRAFPIDQYISERGKGTVINLGYVDHEALAPLYQGAAAIVFPSLYEGFGIPVIEAQKLGILVVCSNSSCLPDIGGDGALYFDPRDELNLHHALDSILSTDVRNLLTAKGLINEKRFSWENSARITTQVYNKAFKD